jgi:hypothetical protein
MTFGLPIRKLSQCLSGMPPETFGMNWQLFNFLTTLRSAYSKVNRRRGLAVETLHTPNVDIFSLDDYL